MTRWLALVAAGSLLAGCDAAPDAALRAPDAESPSISPRSPLPSVGQPQADMAVASGVVSSPAEASIPPLALPNTADDAPVTSMIIRHGTTRLQVDSLEPAIAAARQLAERLGGYVAGSAVEGGKERLRQATLELKIPAVRFDELTDGVRTLGTVEQSTVSTEDVGEEYTDVTARMANARRLEERLLGLLASRAGKLQDVLAVERELARTRETIERYEGRLRLLKHRVALSTMTLALHEPFPVLRDHPGQSVLGEAIRQAWRNLVAVVAGLIATLGAILPLAVLAAIAVLLWRHSRKR